MRKQKIKKVNFTGWFIHEDSRANLLAKHPAIHENVFADHVTIKYRPNGEEIANVMHGDVRMIKAVGIASNEFGQAVVVETDFNVSNPVPHITISCANGIGPAYSNELLENGWDVFDEPIELVGTLGTYP